jgi:hypothetical protein
MLTRHLCRLSLAFTLAPGMLLFSVLLLLTAAHVCFISGAPHHTTRTNRSTPVIHHAIPLTLDIHTASQYCTSHRRLYFDVHVELTPVRLHQPEILENRCEKGVYANNEARPKI